MNTRIVEFEDILINLPGCDKIFILTATATSSGVSSFFDCLDEKTEVSVVMGDFVSEDPTVKAHMAQLGVKLFIRESDGSNMHAKLFLLRKKRTFKYIAYIGSANLTYNSMWRNDEIMVKITDNDLCRQFLNTFYKIQDKSISFKSPLGLANAKTAKRGKEESAREAARRQRAAFDFLIGKEEIPPIPKSQAGNRS
jgi:phosphatidylserine/phosphatidylglycerophosphate/cardiolipin synthase-like enzyme